MRERYKIHLEICLAAVAEKFLILLSECLIKSPVFDRVDEFRFVAAILKPPTQVSRLKKLRFRQQFRKKNYIESVNTAQIVRNYSKMPVKCSREPSLIIVHQTNESMRKDPFFSRSTSKGTTVPSSRKNVLLLQITFPKYIRALLVENQVSIIFAHLR